MKEEKILPREKYEKKQNRKKDFKAFLIIAASTIVVGAIAALMIWLFKTEKEESFPTNNDEEAMVYSAVILTTKKEYVGKCTVEIAGEWIYKNQVSDDIKGTKFGIEVKDSDVKDVLVDIDNLEINISGDTDKKDVFDSFTIGLSKWAENGQSVQHIATMNVYDNFQKVIIRYIDSKYMVVAPATNAEEAEAVLEYENQKLLEQFNK